MGLKLLSIAMLFALFFGGITSWAAEPFYGCADYCRMKSGINKLKAGETASYGMTREYDNCVLQSQEEGYCGKKPKSQITNVPVPTPAPRPSKSPAPSPSPSPVAVTKSLPPPSVCVNQYQSAVASCSNDYSSASGSCSTENNPTLNAALSAASTASLAVGAQTGGSVQAACSNMGNVSQASSAALIAYRSSCQQAKDSCVSSCAAARKNLDDCVANAQSDYASQFTGYQDKVQAQTDFRVSVEGTSEYTSVLSQLNSCNRFQTRIDEAASATQNMAATAMNSRNCTSATAASVTGTTASGGGGSSGMTSGSDSRVIFCQQNPNDATCRGDTGSEQKMGGLEGGGGGVVDPSRSSGKADSLRLGSQGPVLGAQIKTDKGSAEDPGGKKGRGVALGADATPLPDKWNKHAGASLNAGRYAYQDPGGGGFYAADKGATVNFGSTASGNSGKGAGAFVSGSRAITASAGSPDLRKFLPGGARDPERNLAGVSGPDGITGPHSSLWEKVQNRYRIMESSLLP